MEKGNIKIVEIADFKNSEHVLDYVDNDFVIINSLEEALQWRYNKIRMLPYRYLSRRLHPVGRQLQNLPTGSRRLTARPSQYHYQPRDGKPEAQDKACRILHTVPTTRGQDGEGYMEYRYAYPQIIP